MTWHRIEGRQPPRCLTRKVCAAAASVLPGAGLLLIPKCPLCLAAWLTVFTGVGISVALAAYLKGLLVIVCVTALPLPAALLLRRARRSA